jgi:hypothetical protein
VIKLLCADNFFIGDTPKRMVEAAQSLPFVEKEYGQEVDQFNLVVPDLDPIFSKLLGEEVTVVDELSGVFRKPMFNIHFESFESLGDWVFYIALEKTTFNLYNHIVDVGKVDATSALDGYKFNYLNLMEWDCYSNILLEPNQGVIFKPWLFHSVSGGLVQVYRLRKK